MFFVLLTGFEQSNGPHLQRVRWNGFCTFCLHVACYDCMLMSDDVSLPLFVIMVPD